MSISSGVSDLVKALGVSTPSWVMILMVFFSWPWGALGSMRKES